MPWFTWPPSFHGRENVRQFLVAGRFYGCFFSLRWEGNLPPSFFWGGLRLKTYWWLRGFRGGEWYSRNFGFYPPKTPASSKTLLAKWWRLPFSDVKVLDFHILVSWHVCFFVFLPSGVNKSPWWIWGAFRELNYKLRIIYIYIYIMY